MSRITISEGLTGPFPQAILDGMVPVPTTKDATMTLMIFMFATSTAAALITWAARVLQRRGLL